MTTDPLDVSDLMSAIDEPGFDGLPAGTAMGHVHLRVADVPAAVAFYSDILGYGLMASFGAQAAFLGAGGYHHHVGANTWGSAGAPPAPAGAARLERATIVLPDAASRDRLAAQAQQAGFATEALEDGAIGLRDPSGNPLALRAAG
jgi:catechol 2,3-dioxygenase